MTDGLCTPACSWTMELQAERHVPWQPSRALALQAWDPLLALLQQADLQDPEQDSP